MDRPAALLYPKPVIATTNGPHPYLIGIDTGGTYTDAVVFHERRGVLAKAKALTTRADLALGIGAALDAVMAWSGIGADEIGTVAVSTTLATNAIVEGLGGRVCLVAIGFAKADLDRAGLREATREDALVMLPGGHDAFGEEAAALDLAPLDRWLAEGVDAVSAFAIAAHFSVANPDHEDRARAFLTERTGKPVTCSHDLSARLNGPKRALTSVLNARLIPVIHHLIDATETLLRARAVRATLMIVKGDGSLLSLAQARLRPIETILSGPAASLVGAGFLTGIGDAIVSDIGGTTTDIGVLSGGRPRLDPDGATVAGYSTFVEAVAMRTFGLGADSEVSLAEAGSTRPVVLGPRRVVPISLLAAQHPGLVHDALNRQLALPTPPDDAGRFAVRTGVPAQAPAHAGVERDLLDRLAEAPLPVDRLVGTVRGRSALTRLVGTGAVTLAAFAPSDAAHVLGLYAAWDRDAATKAAELFARRHGTGGKPLAADARAMSRVVLDALVATSADRLIDVALAEDGFALDRPSAHPLMRAALSRRSGLAEIAVRLTRPLVGLGASAPLYYPDVAAAVGATGVIPEHADVANAIGAVVGRIRVEARTTVSRPDDGRFRVHGAGVPRDFHDEAEALAFAQAMAEDGARARARTNGAREVEVRVSVETVSAKVADHDLVLEWIFTAVAVGRPGFA